MNNTSSLEQTFQIGNHDSNLITGQYNSDLMARFLENKSMIPRLKQDQIAIKLGCSCSTLKRYRNDIYKCVHLEELHQILTKETKVFK